MNKQALKHITKMLDVDSEVIPLDHVVDELMDCAVEDEGFNPLQPYEVYIEDGEIKHRNVDIR